MENERKHGFIAQVYLLILASMAILGVVTYISQYQAAKKKSPHPGRKSDFRSSRRSDPFHKGISRLAVAAQVLV